jgi:hypothetical protein
MGKIEFKLDLPQGFRGLAVMETIAGEQVLQFDVVLNNDDYML